jgi:hypothetical protein
VPQRKAGPPRQTGKDLRPDLSGMMTPVQMPPGRKLLDRPDPSGDPDGWRMPERHAGSRKGKGR